MSRSIKSVSLPDELANYPRFEDFDTAMAQLEPEAVSINSRPNTHADLARKALRARAHVFMEKPIATTVDAAREVAALALAVNRKLVLGYILRVHPTWIWHRDLIDSLMPIVDSGVHYVDVMRQLTGARPVRVHGIAAALWGEAAKPSYGHLHVAFDDGSIGWYEAGWGPMMSGNAHLVREILGPQGAVSIVRQAEARLGAAARGGRETDVIQVHHAMVSTETKSFIRKDETFVVADAPDHQELCDREQGFFLRAIREDMDLSEHLDATVDSLRVVLAAEQSMNEMRVVDLA
jgi:predicted dehydrogenase